MKALILTGSLARDEATCLLSDGRQRLLSDVEFILVIAEGSALPDRSQCKAVCQKIQDALRHKGTECRVSLSAVHANYLRKIRPHIFGYELRTCGKVVAGDPEVLSLIPDFAPSNIPREDAWRLVCNRMIELIEVLSRHRDGSAGIPREASYPIIKLYLDLATSFLLFIGFYEPTYRGRAEALQRVAQTCRGDSQYPFAPNRFSERVRECTEIKLQGFAEDQIAGSLFGEEAMPRRLQEAVTYTEGLWRWELAQLARVRCVASDDALLQAWMACQPLAERLRGWLSLVKRGGRPASGRDAIRWLRLGLRASCRYWVYAAASELFFQLPRLMRNDDSTAQSQEDWNTLLSWIPVSTGSRASDEFRTWRQVASDIAWNYHQFLETTRA